MTDSIKRYHAVAIALHWVIGLALLANLVLGLLLDDMPDLLKNSAYQLHKSLGITVLVLSLVRLAWRLIKPPPAELPSMKNWEKVIARITYALFYILMLGIPLSGWAMVSAAPVNFPTIIFGLFALPHMPFFEGVADRKALTHTIKDIHEILSNGMLVLLVLHVGAALRHHFILKDETLLRMTPRFMAGVFGRHQVGR